MLHCKIHSYLILLNRQRIENAQGASAQPSPRLQSVPIPSSIPHQGVQQPKIAHSSNTGAPTPGRCQVIESSVAVLHAFRFFYKRMAHVLVDWTIGQQAFNACMILLLDAEETGNMQHLRLWEETFAIFKHLDDNGVHKIAKLAVYRISEGIARLQYMDTSGPHDLGQRMLEQSNSQQEHEHEHEHALDAAIAEALAAIDLPVSGRSGYLDDTVMGNTGMFLLEDTGLQTLPSESGWSHSAPGETLAAGLTPLSGQRSASASTVPEMAAIQPIHTPGQAQQQQQQLEPPPQSYFQYQPHPQHQQQQQQFSTPTSPYAVGLQPWMHSHPSPALGLAMSAYPHPHPHTPLQHVVPLAAGQPLPMQPAQETARDAARWNTLDVQQGGRRSHGSRRRNHRGVGGGGSR